MTGRKYTPANWLIYLLVLAILLASCSPPQPRTTTEPPTSRPSPSPAPTATPDPDNIFKQQLESARAAGYLTASYTGDPTPTPGHNITPQPYVKPIFRVFLDTHNDNVGDQLIYTSASPACSGSNSLANLFSVTLNRPNNLCSGATYSV